jgi:hypothetical protein
MWRANNFNQSRPSRHNLQQQHKLIWHKLGHQRNLISLCCFLYNRSISWVWAGVGNGGHFLFGPRFEPRAMGIDSCCLPSPSTISLDNFLGRRIERTPKQPVSKRLVMKFKKLNFASVNTPKIKTAKIHNAYMQNTQFQKAQFCCIATIVLNMRTKKYYSLIAEQFCKA